MLGNPPPLWRRAVNGTRDIASRAWNKAADCTNGVKTRTVSAAQRVADGYRSAAATVGDVQATIRNVRAVTESVRQAIDVIAPDNPGPPAQPAAGLLRQAAQIVQGIASNPAALAVAAAVRNPENQARAQAALTGAGAHIRNIAAFARDVVALVQKPAEELTPYAALDAEDAVDALIPKESEVRIEEEMKLPIESRRAKTDSILAEFQKKVTYYTFANIIYSHCAGEKITSDREFILITNELMNEKNPGIFKVVSVVIKHFKEINWFKAVFTYIFYCVIAKHYISSISQKMLHYIREQSNNGKDAKSFVLELFQVVNTFIIQYNTILRQYAVQGEAIPKDDFLRQAFTSKAFLQNNSPAQMYKIFGDLFAKKFVPEFDLVSKPLKNFRTLSFWTPSNIFGQITKGAALILIYASLWGFASLLVEWLLGGLPTKMIKKACAKLVSEKTPSLLETSTVAIKRPTVLLAFNKSIYQLLSNLLTTIRSPQDTAGLDEQVTLDDTMRKQIVIFARNVITTLDRVPADSPESLRKVIQHGRQPTSPLEHGVRAASERITGNLNFYDSIVTNSVQKALQEVMKLTYGYLSDPRRTEPLLSQLLVLLKSAFDNPKEMADMQKDLEDMPGKLRMRRDQFIREITHMAISDNVDSFYGKTSAGQKANIVKNFHRLDNKTAQAFEQAEKSLTNLYKQLNPQTSAAKEFNCALIQIELIFSEITNSLKNDDPEVTNAALPLITSVQRAQAELSKNLTKWRKIYERLPKLKKYNEQLQAWNASRNNAELLKFAQFLHKINRFIGSREEEKKNIQKIIDQLAINGKRALILNILQTFQNSELYHILLGNDSAAAESVRLAKRQLENIPSEMQNTMYEILNRLNQGTPEEQQAAKQQLQQQLIENITMCRQEANLEEIQERLTHIQDALSAVMPDLPQEQAQHLKALPRLLLQNLENLKESIIALPQNVSEIPDFSTEKRGLLSAATKFSADVTKHAVQAIAYPVVDEYIESLYTLITDSTVAQGLATRGVVHFVEKK